MATNKVVYGNQTLIDLTNDTVTPSDVLSGATFHDKSGALRSGSLDISGKADKVSNATNGNFAGLDSSGNLTDSGKKASDFSTVKTRSNPASGGTTLSLVNTGDMYNWNSKTSNTGTVTSVATGAGLTGGKITGSGTIKAKLVSETRLSDDSLEVDDSYDRTYPVLLDKSGNLATVVPWGFKVSPSSDFEASYRLTRNTRTVGFNMYTEDFYGDSVEWLSTYLILVELIREGDTIASVFLYKDKGYDSSNTHRTGVLFGFINGLDLITGHMLVRTGSDDMQATITIPNGYTPSSDETWQMIVHLLKEEE